jgi:SsrA-binding protein
MSLIEHKKAHLQYEIIDTFEAGISLLGTEVKSLRGGRGKLEGGRVVVRGGEAFVVGISIPAFQPSNAGTSYDAERPRKLLLNQKELRAIAAAEQEKGLTCIPLSLYNKGSYLKLKVGIARGKKKQDTRATIREREEKRRTSKLEGRG